MDSNLSTPPWIVIKFGGTSVSSRNCWQNITKIITKHRAQGLRPLVVCSAPSGVSNLLETLLLKSIEAERADLLLAIQEKYYQLAQELEIDCRDYLSREFTQLEHLIQGVHWVGEVTPRVQARVMAYGELLLTHLGTQYLKQQGLNVAWQDVREWLQVESHPDFRHPDAYLSARCASEQDARLQQKCAVQTADVVVTQGFIARNERGETVLLGRGGSDSSATYLAAKMGASRCEIWTDVPGIYTANPKQIPQARLITQLNYDEAQELASMGAKVLHPKCIAPVWSQNIPLHVKYTWEPERLGTEIHAFQSEGAAQIKSVLTKHQIILISIETVQMWHQVGFLAEVFHCFKRHGISIDLVSTSEASVTVSLDRNANSKEPQLLDTLIADLNKFAKATVIAPCASVSLVGRNIRAILPHLGGIFSVFEEQKIYLVAQAANDLNLTFVVDEEQALRLARKLHTLLIEQAENVEAFHLSWAEEFGDRASLADAPWWQSQREALLALAAEGSPRYVYHQASLQTRIDNLRKCQAVNQIFYSMKANNNVDILRLFYQQQLGFECVSLPELFFILKEFPEIDKRRVLFAPNFAPKAEYEQALAQGITVTLDNLYILQHWPALFANKDVFIRIDLGEGSGHHKYVVTGGEQSKFGIPLSALTTVSQIAADYKIRIIGLHSHAGSGILNSGHWAQVFTALAQCLPQFPDVKTFNLGGGLGVVERSGQEPLDLAKLNASLTEAKQRLPHLQIWLEPGRYLVAEAGVLLAKATQIKQKGHLQFVGIETGMNSLIRPMLYGSYHEIVNLTRFAAPKTGYVNVVGPICESGDTLGYSRWMPQCFENDVLLIANVGAYGHTMSSNYNLRAPAEEYYWAEDVSCPLRKGTEAKAG